MSDDNPIAAQALANENQAAALQEAHKKKKHLSENLKRIREMLPFFKKGAEKIKEEIEHIQEENAALPPLLPQPVGQNREEALLAMYDAQAFAVEKQMEMDRMRMQLEELAEKLRVFEAVQEAKMTENGENLENPDENNQPALSPAPVAIDNEKLRQEMEEMTTVKMHPTAMVPYYTDADFISMEPIKSGNGGVISIGKLENSEEISQVAVKKFIIGKEAPLDKFKKEIEVLIKYREYPYIVKLHGILWNGIDESIFLGYVMEYIPGGSLHDVIHNTEKSYDFPQIYQWIKHISRGLQFLHINDVIHRDIKPLNILVADNALKLADFGCAKNIDTSTTAGAGTYHYMAPEMLLGKSNFSADIYSLAITIWEIFHRKIPYFDLEESVGYALLTKISTGVRPKIDTKKMDKDVAVLIERCWHQTDSDRPTISEILEFFTRKERAKKMDNGPEKKNGTQIPGPSGNGVKISGAGPKTKTDEPGPSGIKFKRQSRSKKPAENGNSNGNNTATKPEPEIIEEVMV